MKDTTRTLGTTITFTLLIAACGEEVDPLAELEFREAERMFDPKAVYGKKK